MFAVKSQVSNPVALLQSKVTQEVAKCKVVSMSETGFMASQPLPSHHPTPHHTLCIKLICNIISILRVAKHYDVTRSDFKMYTCNEYFELVPVSCCYMTLWSNGSTHSITNCPMFGPGAYKLRQDRGINTIVTTVY